MGKWLDAFLEFKNEAGGTRKFALFAVIVITFGLISLAVTGVVATAHWTWISALPTIGLIIAVMGGEILATVAFIRMLTAPTMKRKVIGFFIFLGLAAVGVHNAENGAKVVWPDRFAESSSSLSAKSGLAEDRAVKDSETRDKLIADLPNELAIVRKDIAKLEAESELMRSNTRIVEAQERLVELGLYPADMVDGERKEITRRAMAQRGEKIQSDIALLKNEERQLRTSISAPVAPLPEGEGDGEEAEAEAAPAVLTQDDLKIRLEEQARNAFWAWFWLILMLCVLESARSLSLWAFITDIEAKDSQRDRQREDELAEAEHQAKLAAIRATIAPPPEPAPQTAPEPQPEPIAAREAPSPPEPAAPVPGRAGGLGNAQNRKAEKAKAGRVIPVGDHRARDADAKAAKEAAQ